MSTPTRESGGGRGGRRERGGGKRNERGQGDSLRARAEEEPRVLGPTFGGEGMRAVLRYRARWPLAGWFGRVVCQGRDKARLVKALFPGRSV